MKVFKIALPGSDVHNSRLNEEALNSQYTSPKVDTTASPSHAGIYYLDWASSNVIVPENTTRILHTFKHNYNYIPTVIGVYTFDNGTTKISGVLPFAYGDIGIVTMDTDITSVNLKYFSYDISSATPVTPFTMKIRFYVFAERGIE